MNGHMDPDSPSHAKNGKREIEILASNSNFMLDNLYNYYFSENKRRLFILWSE